MRQMQALFDDGNEHVGAHCNSYLGLDRVLARIQKRIDAQVLLDPFEEQRHLPTTAVKGGNQFGFEGKVVGQKRDAFAGFVFDDHSAQGAGVVLAGNEYGQHTGLVAHRRGIGAIDRVRVAPLELGLAFDTGDKEGLSLVNGKQSGKVQIPSVQQIEDACSDRQIVEHIDFLGLAVADMDEAGNGAAQIEQCMELDGCPGTAKWHPRVHRQAQIDGRRIKGVDGCIQFHGQGFAGVEGASDGNEKLHEIGVNLPKSGGVDIGQRVALSGLTAKAHVVEPLGLNRPIELDVSQRFAPGQLRKCHDQKQVQTEKVFNFVLAAMGDHAAAKSCQWQMRHELQKHKLALAHGCPSPQRDKNSKSAA